MSRNPVEILRGTPRVITDSGWLDIGPRVYIFEEEDGFGIDFKVEGLLDEDASYGAEFLAAMANNRPDDIRIGLQLSAFGIDIHLCVNGEQIVWLGSVPRLLEAILRKNWNCFIVEKILTVRKFQVGISFVGKEVDKNLVLDGAELIEGMPEKEIDELLSSIRTALDKTVYVIKMGFFVGRRNLKALPG